MIKISLGEEKSVRDVKLYSPLSLAYVGDGVFEMLVRTHLAVEKNLPADTLHKAAKRYVSASAQSAFYDAILERLSEEELELLKRGRNAKIKSHRKNLSVEEYKKATGLECLFGFLFLTGRTKRLSELFEEIKRLSDETA